MDKTFIVSKKVKFNNAIMITGLPGIGLIGRIAAEYIYEKLKAEQFATLYSPHFPPQVLMNKDGVMKPITNSFYHVNLKKDKDLIILLGDVQAIDPIGQYKVVGEIAKFAKKIGVKEIITIGGYATGKLENKEIYGSANSKKMVEKFKKFKVNFSKPKGSIVGIAGLLPAMAIYYNIPSICLMATTHGSFVDPSGAKRIVKLLSKYLNVKINLADLDKKAKEEQEIIKKVEEEIKKSFEQQAHKSLSYIR